MRSQPSFRLDKRAHSLSRLTSAWMSLDTSNICKYRYVNMNLWRVGLANLHENYTYTFLLLLPRLICRQCPSAAN